MRVDVRLGPRGRSLGCVGHRLQRERVHQQAHLLAGRLPDGEEYALAFVVARAVLVRFAEVAEADGAIDGAEDLADANLCSGPSQHVATAHSALGAHETGTLQREEDLLQVRLRDGSAFGDVTHRGGTR